MNFKTCLYKQSLHLVSALLCFTLACTTSYAIEVKTVLGDVHEMYQPREQVFYLWDKNNNLTFEEVSNSPLKNGFIHAGKDAISFGIRKENLWFRIAVKNNIPEKQKEWFFEMAYPHFDSLEFYFQNEKGEWQKQLTGDKTPFATRQLFNKHFIFPVHLPDTTTRVFYFHIGGEGSRQFPLYIETPRTFYENQEAISIVYGGIFFGTILIMLLYNLFIYFALKDKVYLYYVITTASIFCFYLSYTGYGFQFIWRDHYEWNGKMMPLVAMLAGISTIVFTKNFLETKKYITWIDSVFCLFMYAYIIEIALCFFVSYETALKAASITASLSALLILFSSYSIWYKGNKSAKFIAIAFTFYLLGIVLLNMNIVGFVHRSFIVAHGMEIGTTIEMTLLSFALSHKYTRLKKEREETQTELIQIQKETNEELEKKIERRTQKINQQKVELEESNKVKDKLLSIISHDLKGPLNSFQTLLSMMIKDELTKENINMYTSHLNNKLGLMINLVDNILNWVRTQMEGMKFDIQQMNIKDIVKENIHLFSSQAELKKIHIIDEVPDNTFIMGDKNVVRMVVRNLLANALKFTKNEGRISIHATHASGVVRIEVKDTGIGIPSEKMKLLFTDAHFTSPDTNHNAGTGIGLLLCKEFLSKTGGDIWVESVVDEGSNFIFTLPAANA